MSAEPRYVELLAALTEEGVAFVLVGGVAAIAHGVLRATDDVDVVPASDGPNLDRLAAALRSIDALPLGGDVAYRGQFPRDGAELAGLAVWNLDTALGRLDLLRTPAGTTGFADLAGAATATDIGVPVLLASVADLIRMKAAAGRERDLLDIAELRRLG